MAFLSIFRLILPEATPAKQIMSSKTNKYVLRILTVFLPLIAHLPFYLMLYHQLALHGGCDEAARNRITINLENETVVKGQLAAAYLTTAKEIEAPLIKQLKDMSLFPMNIDSLPKANRMPSTQEATVLSLRNSFNVFGHFFLWTGSLALADLSLVICFLCYWTFVIQPHQTLKQNEVSKVNEVVKPRIATEVCAEMNAVADVGVDAEVVSKLDARVDAGVSARIHPTLS